MVSYGYYGTRPMTASKALNLLLGALLGALGRMVARIPAFIAMETHVFVVLLLLDTATGMWLSVCLKELRSRRMRDMVLSKLFQYTIILVLCRCAGYLAGTWVIDGAGCGLCIATEFVSNLENLASLERVVGLPLSPAIRKYLRSVGDVLAYTGHFPEAAPRVVSPQDPQNPAGT